MYSYVAGRGIFTECLTEIDFPVVAEAENAALERAYMNTPHGQAESILVNLDARLISRPKMGGLGYEEAVVPDRFIDIRPGIACDGEKSSKLRLVDNSWRLVELNGKLIELPEGVKTPFIYLATKNNQMRGFSGCNSFNGTYLVKGDLFLFNKMFIRRMACVGGMEIEDRFYRMLSAAEGYKITGDILELRNRNGQVLARFQHIGGN
jgi:heat shock protein HslJ